MKTVFSLVFFATSFALASDGFTSFKKSFDQAQEPKVENLAGWYSGRCYTQLEPTVEKAGLLVVFASTNAATGKEGLKIIMPGNSVRSEVDFWDQLNEEKIESASSMMWPKNMQEANMENGSLSNILIYDMPSVPSGKLSLREEAQSYQLRFGNIYEDSEWIFCRIQKEKIL